MTHHLIAKLGPSPCSTRGDESTGDCLLRSGLFLLARGQKWSKMTCIHVMVAPRSTIGCAR